MSTDAPRNVSRRSLFSTALAGGSLLALSATGMRRALAETPVQPEGPFHPINRDTDLVQLSPGARLARGQIIHMVGRVHDESGAAIPGALIEIWQADENGKYQHPADPLDLTPDPDFQFWGRATSDASGEYAFRTIKPGAYPAGPGWVRPPHIHVRVARRGFHELTTQMYFAGEALNADDRILSALPARDQAKLIVSFAPTERESRPGTRDLLGRFDIELARVR
jgi:protocatechuate 3,4-dioxygenase beta subunit